MARPHCGNDPRAQLTDGDRRAVEDFKAYLADRAALRDRIAAAIWERQNPGRRWADCEYRWRADAEEDATAVLAVLPPPADRTAVLTAGERQFLRFALDLAFDRMVSDDGFTDEDEAALARLRRLADETPSAEADVEHCVHDRAVHTRHHHTPVTGCPWCGAAAGTRQDGAQP